MIVQESLTIRTRGRELYEVTEAVQEIVAACGIVAGIVNLFLHHTSASLILCENADPAVQRDLEVFMSRLVPDGSAMFEHIAEGPDDMPAHVRTILTQNSLTVPLAGHRCDVGTWQGIYVWEHRHNAHSRRLTVTVQGS